MSIEFQNIQSLVSNTGYICVFNEVGYDLHGFILVWITVLGIYLSEGYLPKKKMIIHVVHPP